MQRLFLTALEHISPRLVACTLALGTALAGPALAQQAETGCNLPPRTIFEREAKAVLEVLALKINPYRVSGRVVISTGSAFVIEEGHVVTNYHVVADASEVYLNTGDDMVPAMVLGTDPTLDVAVLDPMYGLGADDHLVFADPASVAVGDQVYALGYPLGIGETISHGLISGIGRILPQTTSNWLEPYLQTDAAISPGNSGGPLLDECGQVVGMITLGAPNQIANDIGFAIPVEVLTPIVEELLTTGKVARAWHGLYGQMVSPAILTMMGAPPDEIFMTGFLVETVEPGSAADRAGLVGGTMPIQWGMNSILLGGDIITKVNGTEVDSLETALDLVRSLKIGDTVSIDYLRYGTPNHAEVTIEERPVQEGELDFYRRGE